MRAVRPRGAATLAGRAQPELNSAPVGLARAKLEPKSQRQIGAAPAARERSAVRSRREDRAPGDNPSSELLKTEKSKTAAQKNAPGAAGSSEVKNL